MYVATEMQDDTGVFGRFNRGWSAESAAVEDEQAGDGEADPGEGTVVLVNSPVFGSKRV